MQIAIIKSIIFVLAEVSLYVMLWRMKKSDKILPGLLWTCLTIITGMCYQGVVLGVLNIAKVPINIVTASVVAICSAIVMFILLKDKERQQYEWCRYECIGAIIILLGVSLIFIKLFTKQLLPIYYNTDSAVHFKNAMRVLHNQELHNMYFSSMWGAFFVEIFALAMKQVLWYKLFMIYDGCMFIFEAVFTWTLINQYLNDKKGKLIAPVFMLFLLFGFPFNAFLYSFVYVNMGVMVFLYILQNLKMYAENTIAYQQVLVYLMLGCGCITITYMVYGPFVFILVFLILLTIQRKDGKLFSKKHFNSWLFVFILPTVISIYYSYYDFLRVEQESASGIASIEGGCYREVYTDFLFVLPLIIYYIVDSLRKKEKLDVMAKALAIWMLIYIPLFIATYKGMVSVYYFNKIYYPMWCLCFIVALQGMLKIWKQDVAMMVTFSSCFILAAATSFGGVEAKIIQSGRGFTEGMTVERLFHVYWTNRDIKNNRPLQFSPEFEAGVERVISLQEDEDTYIPLLLDQNQYGSVFWYEAMTGKDGARYFGWFNDIEEIKQKMTQDDIKYVATKPDSVYYAENQEFFNAYQLVYENTEFRIYAVR